MGYNRCSAHEKKAPESSGAMECCTTSRDAFKRELPTKTTNSKPLFALRHRRTRAKVPAIVHGGPRRTYIWLVGRYGPITLQQDRRHRVFGFLHEDHLVLRSHVNANEIPQLHLSGRDQIGQ